MPSDSKRIARLQRALDERATEKSRAFWTRYLKGDAAFRGVPMKGVREATHTWWAEEGVASLEGDAQFAVALALFEQEFTEDKLAGVIALAELLLHDLRVAHLPALADLFEEGHISDWNLCDWFCVKVLGKMVEHAAEPLTMASAIAEWRNSKPLWQRRAACVAFVNHAKQGDTQIEGLTELILESADALVRDPERFAQTGVGWVLRELSLAELERVVAFTEEHAHRMTREALKSIVQKMPEAEQRRLATLHSARSPPTRGRARRGRDPAK